MGLLDDAIREHLELKRRRGADPTEIEREESEALGPVRRGDVELDEDFDDRSGRRTSRPGSRIRARPTPTSRRRSPRPDAERAPPARRARAGDHPVPAEPPLTHDAPFAEPRRRAPTPPHGDPWMQQPTREFSSDELNEALSDTRAAPRRAGPGVSVRDPDVVPADGEGRRRRRAGGDPGLPAGDARSTTVSGSSRSRPRTSTSELTAPARSSYRSITRPAFVTTAADVPRAGRHAR